MNLAARLQTAAEPDSVIVSQATYERTSANFRYAPLAPLTYLTLIRPDGTVAASSLSSKSVFERVRVRAPVRGRWIMRIRGFNVLMPQWVYLALALE